MAKPTTKHDNPWLDRLPTLEKFELEVKLKDLLTQRKYGQPGFGQKPGPVLIKRLLARLNGDLTTEHNFIQNAGFLAVAVFCATA